MIIQQHFLNKLKDFGLNTYEGKLWTALLSRGVSTAGELSDIANVPRSRSYDVLESLEKKGFIIMKVGKPIKYIAVPPEEVIERVKKKITETAESQSNMLEDLKASEVLTELNALHTQGIDLVEPADLTGSLKGRPALYNHLEMMIKGAKKSVVIMTSSEGLVRKAEALRNVLHKASDRGVNVRIAAPLDNDAKKAATVFEGIAEIRHIDSIKSRFCIIDESQISFMLLDDKKVHPTYDSAIWANTDFFATSLQGFFNNEWDKLKPMKKTIKA